MTSVLKKEMDRRGIPQRELRRLPDYCNASKQYRGERRVSETYALLYCREFGIDPRVLRPDVPWDALCAAPSTQTGEPMTGITKSVFGGSEKPAISSRALAPAWPDKNHGHLLSNLRKVLSDMDPSFKGENTKIVYLRGRAKRWGEVLLTEAGANAFLDCLADSFFPQMRQFALDARSIVAAHFADDAAPDKFAQELDALNAKNVALADKLANALKECGDLSEACDEWKAKLEKSEKEAEARAEFDRARILGLEATVSDLEEKLHVGEEEEGGECDRCELEVPRKSCIDCVPRIEAEMREEEARNDRRMRATRAITDHLVSNGMPPLAAACVALAATHGLGDGGLPAIFGWLKR